MLRINRKTGQKMKVNSLLPRIVNFKIIIAKVERKNMECVSLGFSFHVKMVSLVKYKIPTK